MRLNVFQLLLGRLDQTLKSCVLLFLLLKDSSLLREVLLIIHLVVHEESVDFIEHIGLHEVSDSLRSVGDVFWSHQVVLDNNLVIDCKDTLNGLRALILNVCMLL